jgi:hypothetical protein
MTLDDDDLPPQRPVYDDKTDWGRINGRDKRKYARLWGVDLDQPADDDYSGEEHYSLCIKMMFIAHCEAEGPIGEPGHRKIDLEEFARAWRPPTESEMLDEIIAERRRAEQDASALDPETRH